MTHTCTWKWDQVTDRVEPICAWGDEYAEAFKIENRRLARESVTMPDGKVLEVSTVFLCIEHPGGLFETMIFDPLPESGGYLDYQWRYPTAHSAREGHKAVVAWVQGGMNGETP